MSKVARHQLNTLRERNMRIQIHDLTGDDGRPWTDLLGNPLQLKWNVTAGERVLGRGMVDPDGWIVINLQALEGAEPAVLRVGPAATGPGPKGLAAAEAAFDWCETFQLTSPPALLPLEDPRGVLQRLDYLGYNAQLIAEETDLDTETAIFRYQCEHDLPPTGEIDDQTRSKIQEQFLRLQKEARNHLRSTP